ncbi:hypothetical protein V6N13_042987 [Hibiscus sabdariffa]
MAQQSTQDYFAQSQADFLAKVAEMLTDKDPMTGKCLVIDPRAMQKMEDPASKTHLFASPVKQGLQVESLSHEGIDVKNNPGDYIVHDLKATGKVEIEVPKNLEDLCQQLEKKNLKLQKGQLQ